jgi:hypothetical protein
MKRGFAGIRLVVFVSLLGLLGLTDTLWCVSQRPSYVVLLDVSGSMEREGPVRYARYSSGQMSNLVRQLGVTIAAADPDAQVTVQPFSSSKERYPASAEVRPSELGSLVPRTAAGLETELDYALKIGMNNRPNLLLFMITDNQNDFRGSKSDQDFYQLLAKDASIHTVYFVPLANTSNAQDALVLYAIASGSASRSTLRYVTNDFARSQHSEAVQFRGFYDDKEQETLRFAQHILLSDETGDDRSRWKATPLSCSARRASLSAERSSSVFTPTCSTGESLMENCAKLTVMSKCLMDTRSPDITSFLSH